ncbi:alpha/beta fold hydrolase [Streptomyces sp. A7024]|uniref:Alpha/beta fold hydrolase n=1 Tax=Streptomyces coryli TaxID=1128680 RepID=A0A6G4TYH8_9ACTN|nr:alpha/beta fold hydrolase [Streptomyces coryli]NGN64580.1 alpha/beta fold hydrolase [Streptomyces coryli]
MRNRPRHALVAGIGAAVVIAGSVLLPNAAAERRPEAAARVEAPVPELDWSACGAQQCAEAQVPLDYDEPDGDTVKLAMTKFPATGSGEKTGTLFLNLGGPGAKAVGDPTFALSVRSLGPEVRAKFDIVGIDPRGVGGSAPATCPPAPGREPVAKPATMIPETPDEVKAQLAYDDYLRASCDETAGPILDHMSMADVARDMDLVRQAVGDEQLTYYGISYGSLLGQTYAALFPDRVRALAIDGVLDPVASTTGRPGDDRPVGVRMGRPEAMEQALATLLAHCDKAGILRCPLAGQAMMRWQRVHDSLAERPLELGPMTIDGRSFRGLYTVNAFQVDHMGGYPLPTIELLAAATKLIEVLRFGPGDPAAGQTRLKVPGRSAIDLSAPRSVLEERLAGLLAEIRKAAAERVPTPAPAAEDVSAGLAGMFGALCTDSVNPADPNAWVQAAKDTEARAPRFGPLMVWVFSPCAGWPGSSADAYRGPFDTRLTTPPLIIGNARDAATPIGGGEAARDLLPGSRLITLDAWGHTALGKSGCVTKHVESYLIKQQLPGGDQHCKTDYTLFGLPG